ncbi:translation initiation factor IF-2 [Patescibacteria group bacterium]|nr:translation initiation factor IF-2 [Patescibacteria group bacterium]
MNITELARILRISPQELRDLLPELGFAIGQKAIKVDNNTAKKIIRNWPSFRRQWEQRKAAERAKKQDEEILPKEKRTIKIPAVITVRALAEVSQIPVNRILTELIKNGVFASINEKIDFDAASIIGSDLNLDVQLLEEDTEAAEEAEEKKLQDILNLEKPEDMEVRPPVIVVMGHVDHGKTKLLDSIRLTNVISGEAGGITQHIGAYQVTRSDRALTFIDTPGHEAFTAMRSRGAKVADIAILVVAADDGVKPQTVEAFRIIEAAKLPFLVAINKIDKPEADVTRTMQDLANKLNITPEDWGGKTICVPISAKEGTGIEELLDMVLLTADAALGDTLRANPDAEAAGTVVESNMDKAAGPVATLLVQNGTLHVGDQLCFEDVIYGKVKSLKNHLGENIKAAGLSVPVKILGLKISPSVGDILYVGEGKKVKMRKIKSADVKKEKIMSIAQQDNADDNTPKLNIIIKSDFLGSAEAIEESLMKINTEIVKVKIISKGLGNVTEGDVKRAEDSSAQIICFNTKMSPAVENVARNQNIEVKSFSIIYDLIKYVKEEMQKMVPIEVTRVDLGKLKVLAIFRTEKQQQIIGGKVISGKPENNVTANVWRGEDFVTTGLITSLQSAKQEVKFVEEGEECGLRFEGEPVILEGDVLEFYREDKKIKQI